MSVISVDDVNYVASLAKIAITPEEAAQLTKELDSILGYVKQLEAVDTTGLQPTYQVTGLKNVMRPDEEIDYGTTQAELLMNAPHSRDGAIEVPKVL